MATTDQPIKKLNPRLVQWIFWVGILLAILGAWRDNLIILISGSSTKGKVEELAWIIGSNQAGGINEGYNIMSYEVDGITYAYNSKVKSFTPGQTVKIYYQKSDPRNALLLSPAEFIFMELWVFLLFTIVWIGYFHFQYGLKNIFGVRSRSTGYYEE